jgi:Na+-transporting methylmalonyl-CoA/oxaloacetate decarboxylase gamma subunit
MTGLSNTFVCLMSIGTVFIGLICIVFICMAMSAVFKMFAKNEKSPASVAAAPAPVASAPALSGAEKSAVLAGVCACIAEELGTDCSNIKVVSFKKI